MRNTDIIIAELEEKADRIRSYCMPQFAHIDQGHAGGTMSMIDIITALYFQHMKLDPKDLDAADRDRLVLSKAHCCEGVYAALVELGVYPKETLGTYYGYGSPFQGHADRWCTRGIDFSGGSLGQGISYAAGLAHAEKLKTLLDPGAGPIQPSRYIRRHDPLYRTFCIVGDGECQEGEVWEAAMFASKYRLDNLIVIIDYNKFCLDGPTADVMPIEPLADKWRDFGWWVKEINGHDMREIVVTLELTSSLYGDNRPKCIIAHTVKGRGISEWESIHVHLARGSVMSNGISEGRSRYGQV